MVDDVKELTSEFKAETICEVGQFYKPNVWLHKDRTSGHVTLAVSEDAHGRNGKGRRVQLI